MDIQTKQTNLTEKLNSFLDRACQAEAAGNSEEAGRLFRLSLRCEELSQSEISGTAKNVQQVTLVNVNTKPTTVPEIKDKNYEA